MLASAARTKVVPLVAFI